MPRIPSTDTPYQVPSSRMGVVTAVITANVYKVNIFNGNVTAYWSGVILKTIGERVQVRYDPEKRFWVIPF